MNRGINKVALDTPEKKGKGTKANPIRVDVLVTRPMEERIAEISEAMKIEKAATVRMLLWFGMRFASPFDITELKNQKKVKADGLSTQRLDTRITQEMLDKIEMLMEAEQLSKSSVVKMLIEWALSNINNYTIGDWLTK